MKSRKLRQRLRLRNVGMVALLVTLGFQLMGINACATDADGDGSSVEDGDCDDTNENTYPGATEQCDNLDNDCDTDSAIDEGVRMRLELVDWYPKPSTQSGLATYYPECGSELDVATTLHVTSDTSFTRYNVRGPVLVERHAEPSAEELPQQFRGMMAMHPTPKAQPGLDRIIIARATSLGEAPAPFTLEFYSDSDTTWEDEPAGWLPDNSTFLWASECSQVLPCTIDPGDRVTYYTTVEEDGVLYASEIIDGAPYQASLATGTYVANFMGTGTDGTRVYVQNMPDDDVAGWNDAKQYVVPYFNWYVNKLGSYPWGPEAHIVSERWCEPGTTCDFAGMEEWPYAKTSADNFKAPYGDQPDGTMNGYAFYGGKGIISHELGHIWAGGGLEVGFDDVADGLPYNEGIQTYMGSLCRAQVDGVYSEAQYRTYIVGFVEYYAGSRYDLVVWPKTTSDDNPYANYTTMTYMRGGAFWFMVQDVVGQEAVFDFWRHMRSFAGTAITGDFLLAEFEAHTGVDLYQVGVVMSDGSTSNLVDGWLRTKGSYPTALVTQ